MQNEKPDMYEAPELFELGQAKQHTLGLDEGPRSDVFGQFRKLWVEAVPVEDDI
jgi:hypothetical protein